MIRRVACACLGIILTSTGILAQAQARGDIATHPWIRPVPQTVASATIPHDLRLPIAVAILGSAADLGTTQAAIHSGKFKEGNPFLGQQPAVRIGVSAGLTIGLILGASKLHETHPRLARWILWGYGIARGVIATTTVIRIARQ